jgi:hypothetical protein
MRRFPIRLAALLAIALTLTVGIPQVFAASSRPSVIDPNGKVVTATLDGRPIDPTTASQYYCHTRDYPVVHCFHSQAEVDRDLGIVEPTAPGAAAAGANGVTPDWSGLAYTIAYWDINYGGSTLTVYGAIPSLSVIGWNDNISSFKSVNCGIPRYYVDPNYSGVYWQNACNTWSANLYSYNDTFSAVINEAP